MSFLKKLKSKKTLLAMMYSSDSDYSNSTDDSSVFVTSQLGHDEDRKLIDKSTTGDEEYLAGIEISNACKTYYERRRHEVAKMRTGIHSGVGTTEEVNGAEEGQTLDVRGHGNTAKFERTMVQLRSEMVSLVEMDLQLMELMLRLNDRVDDFKSQNKMAAYNQSRHKNRDQNTTYRSSPSRSTAAQPDASTVRKGYSQDAEKALHSKYGSPSVLSLYTDCDVLLSSERLSVVQGLDATFSNDEISVCNTSVTKDVVLTGETRVQNGDSVKSVQRDFHDEDIRRGVTSVRRRETIRGNTKCSGHLRRPPSLPNTSHLISLTTKNLNSATDHQMSLANRHSHAGTHQTNSNISKRRVVTGNTSLKACHSVPDLDLIQDCSPDVQSTDCDGDISVQRQVSHLSFSLSRSDITEHSVDSGIHVNCSNSDLETLS